MPVDTSSLQAKVAVKLKEQQQPSHKKKPAEMDIQDVLRREALSLGASEKDLELIKDLGADDDELSEQEFGADDQEPADQTLASDVRDYMESMGFDKHSLKDKEEQSLSSDSNENDEESQEEEEEPESEPSSEEEEEEAAKEKGLITDTQLVKSDRLLVPSGTPWFMVPLDPQIQENIKNDTISLTEDQITKLYERGQKALEEDNKVYFEEFTKDSSQRKFMSQILSDGTLNDKISALTLLVQESPLHNTKSMDTLVSYCNKKSRNSILQSLNALKDLFLNGLLPDRKLRFFKNQPGLSLMLNKRTLAIFYYEDYLKKIFFQLLQVLEKLTHDPIIHVRMQVLSHIFDFIISKPEQEFNLLRLGVNKLGDIDSKVASKASYLLLKLQQAHPNMKSIIIDAIVDIALRPNADYHATYYSVITLNQTILKRTEDDVANKLIKTYFTLFEKFLINTDKDNKEDDGTSIKSSAKGYESKRKKNFKKGKKGGKSVKDDKTEQDVISEKNSKLFSALLTGVNRAFPFASLSAAVYEAHLDTLFKITHAANFNTAIQAFVLINQVTVKAKLNDDRYYRTLYESLLDPRLISSSKQGVYLNLLYKSLKQDSGNVERVDAFVKRILQVCCHWLNVGTITGFFYLLLQLMKSIPQIKNLLTNSPMDHEYRSEEEEEEEEEEKEEKAVRPKYDSRKRDPRYANASQTSLWEINYFLTHFHPTVQTYAQALIDEDIAEQVTKPDLGLYTLTHFLDRFVYRNAKQIAAVRGSSIMQPLSGGSQISNTILVKATDVVLNENPVNTEDWLAKKVEDIRPDEKFFYQYFSTKQTAIKGKHSISEKASSDDDELDEDEVWDALVKSRPDVEDDSDEEELEFDDDDFGSMSSDEEENDEEDAQEENDAIENGSDSEEEEEEEDDDDDDDVFYSFRDEENELTDDEEVPGKKRMLERHDDKPSKKSKKKNSIKELPLFASADDYAQYLNSDDESE